MEFEDEACTAVVPVQRMFCDDLALLKKDEQVQVLWPDGNKYWTKFILSGTSQLCVF